MKVIVVSKTRMGGGTVCVGGIVVDIKQPVRLLEANGWYPSISTEYQIGQLWDLAFQPSTNLRAPHIEDVKVTKKTLIGLQPNLANYLATDLGATVWTGGPRSLFEGKLQATGTGSGYISEAGGLPSCSTGFWKPDQPLTVEQGDDGKVKYKYPTQAGIRVIKYVGTQEVKPTIPANTLVRVSLAKWWKQEDSDLAERCYLQLSGWYDP